MDLYARSWCWYRPANAAEHAANLARSMLAAPQGALKQLLMKAGGDGGNVWSEYSGPNCEVYEAQGIDVIPWLYVSTDLDAEASAAIATLKKRRASELMLNCEVEWSYANGITDDYVARFVDGMRSRIRAALGWVPTLGFSSVASWKWFPYSAWSNACDGTEDVQCYWLPETADQADPVRRRSRVGAKIIAALPACQREDSGGQGVVWDNARLAALATYYATGMRDLVGFDGWQSGATGRGGRARTDYGHDAMGAAYRLLNAFAKPVNPTPQVSDFPYDVDPRAEVWHCYLPDGSLDTWVTEQKFLNYWQMHGELEAFGLPISGMGLDEGGRKVQYFERARFELHGDTVVLGRVGAELLDARKWSQEVVRPAFGGLVSAESALYGLRAA